MISIKKYSSPLKIKNEGSPGEKFILTKNKSLNIVLLPLLKGQNFLSPSNMYSPQASLGSTSCSNTLNSNSNRKKKDSMNGILPSYNKTNLKTLNHTEDQLLRFDLSNQTLSSNNYNEEKMDNADDIFPKKSDFKKSNLAIIDNIAKSTTINREIDSYINQNVNEQDVLEKKNLLLSSRRSPINSGISLKKFDMPIQPFKGNIKSNRLILRVLVILFKNMKLYYQIIQDYIENRAHSLQNKTKKTKELSSMIQTDKNLEYQMECLVPEVKSLINYQETKLYKKFSMSIFDDMRTSSNNPNSPKDKQRPPLEMFKNSINTIILVIESALRNRKSRVVLDGMLAEMISQGQKSGNYELNLSCLKLAAKININIRDIYKSIALFKQFKNICYINNDDYNRIKVYKNLGKCYQTIKQYSISLMYFSKLLQLSWFIKSENYEFLAYDLIGKQYFYLGELDKALYYHEKMMNGKTEENQALVQLGISKISNTQGRNKNNYEGAWEKTNTAKGEDEMNLSSGDDSELPIPNFDTMQKEKEQKILDSKYTQHELKSLGKRESLHSRTFHVGLNRLRNEKKRDRKPPLPLFTQGDEEEQNNINDPSAALRASNARKVCNRHKYSFSNLGLPEDKIFLNHLSRNRGLENFNEPSLCQIKSSSDEQYLNDELDSVTIDKVRCKLEKYKKILVAVQRKLEFLMQN